MCKDLSVQHSVGHVVAVVYCPTLTLEIYHQGLIVFFVIHTSLMFFIFLCSILNVVFNRRASTCDTFLDYYWYWPGVRDINSLMIFHYNVFSHCYQLLLMNSLLEVCFPMQKYTINKQAMPQLSQPVCFLSIWNSLSIWNHHMLFQLLYHGSFLI